MVTAESRSDFDATKKAEYYDAAGFEIADKENKEQLKSPRKITELDEENN